MLLKIDSVPEREDPELFDKLQTQMPYFIKICVEALQRMYQREKITVSDHSTAEVEQMRQDSDTVQAFIDECCTTGTRLKADRTDLYGEYTDFCKDADREPLRKTAFFKAMRSKGFTEFKSHGVWYLRGIFYGQKFPKSSPDGEKIPPKDEFNPLIEEEETPFD